MTKQKCDEAKLDAKLALTLSVVALILFLIMLAAADAGYFPDYESRSALAALYNFSEDECVAQAKCFEALKVGATTDWCETNQVFCTLYCRTTQVQDGEVCITEERVELRLRWVNEGRVVYEHVASATWVPNGTTITFNYCELGGYSGVNGCSHYGDFVGHLPSVVQLDEPQFVNRTTCTPTFKNITTFCATAEEVENARRLIG